jgi:hypothetical protein
LPLSFLKKTKMKATKIAVIAAVAPVLLIGTTNAAMARTHVSVGVGIGYPGFYGGWYGHYGPYRRHYHPRSGFFIGVGWLIWWPDDYYPYYYPYYYPGYYVVNPPPAVVVRPPVVENQPTTVQQNMVEPQGVDENTLRLYKNLWEKKSELLTKLHTGDRDSQIQAIRDLAGFSFDDNVRQAIENVLLTNTYAELRIGSAQSLGAVKNTKALPALEKARVDDAEAGIRRAADGAIRNIEGK